MGGNWKLNPGTVSDSVALASELAKLVADVKDVDVAVFPPSPFLVPVQQQIKDSVVNLGAQDCYFESSGAYTGAVSTGMLKDVGVSHVLVGHSERRSLFFDDDKVINHKVKKVLAEGLKPVLCIGETKEEYEAGLNQEVCAIQLMQDLADVSPEEMLNIVIACESNCAAAPLDEGLCCFNHSTTSLFPAAVAVVIAATATAAYSLTQWMCRLRKFLQMTSAS